MDTGDLSTTETDTLDQQAPAAESLREPHACATAPVEPQSVPDSDPAQPSGPDPRLLDHLLKMADDYRAEDALRQAMEIYFELAEAHPDTPQGEQARKWLIALAEHYEHVGAPRQARSIYERLL